MNPGETPSSATLPTESPTIPETGGDLLEALAAGRANRAAKAAGGTGAEHGGNRRGRPLPRPAFGQAQTPVGSTVGTGLALTGKADAPQAPALAQASAARNGFVVSGTHTLATTCGTLQTGASSLRTFTLSATQAEAILRAIELNGAAVTEQEVLLKGTGRIRHVHPHRG